MILVGLNTVLLNFDDQDDPHNLALRQSRWLRAIQVQPRGAPLRVLQHHPPAWLTDGAGLPRSLQDRAHILFGGHIHINRTRAVGCFPGGAAVWWRVFQPDSWDGNDLAGHVWEWTASVYTKDYAGTHQLVLNAEAGGPRVRRGGSWNNNDIKRDLSPVMLVLVHFTKYLMFLLEVLTPNE